MVHNGRHVRFCQQCGRFQVLADFDEDRKSCRRKLQQHNRRRKEARAAAHTGGTGGGEPTSSHSHHPQRSHRHDVMKSDERLSMELGSEPDSTTLEEGGSADVPESSSGATVEREKNPPSPIDLGDEFRGLDIDALLKQLEDPLSEFSGACDDDNATLMTALDDPRLLFPADGVDSAAAHVQQQQHHINTANFIYPQQQQQVDSAYFNLDSGDAATATNAATNAAAAAANDTSMESSIPDSVFIVSKQEMMTSAAAAAPLQPSIVPLPSTMPMQIHDAVHMVTTNHRTAPAVSFSSPADLVRASFKLFNVHPTQLPATISQELHNMMENATMLFQNVRLGCTHMTIEALLTPAESEKLLGRGSKGMLDAAVARGPSFFPESTFDGPNGRVVAQLGKEATIVSNSVSITVGLGGRGDVNNSANDNFAMSLVHSAVPFAALPGSRRCFTLLGSSISGSHDMVVCRNGAAMPDLEVIRSGKQTVPSGGDGSSVGGVGPSDCDEYVHFVIPQLTEGLHCVEVQRGALLSTAAPFIVVDDAEAVAELRQLECDGAAAAVGGDVAAFLRSVGVVLEHLRRSNQNDDDGDETSAAAAGASAIRIASIAQRLVATCVACGWPALLRLMLPAMVSPGASASTAVDGIREFSPERFSLLHLAATSRCAAVVPVLGEWATAAGHIWCCEAAGPSSLTPLHLAALLDDGCAMASSLTALFPQGAALWTNQGSQQGSYSAAAVAALINNTAVLAWLRKRGVGAVDETGGEHTHQDYCAASAAATAAAAIAVANPGKGKAGGSHGLMTAHHFVVDAARLNFNQRPSWSYKAFALQWLCLGTAASFAMYLRAARESEL